MSDPVARRKNTGLEFCLLCGRDFVTVVRCTNAGSDSWWLVLRCGECGTWHETFAQGAAFRALRRSTALRLDTVADESKRLDRERMTNEVEVFSRALELDLIDADDFSSSGRLTRSG